MGNVLSQGTVFAIGDGASPEVFTTVCQITNISGPDGTSTEIDVTNLCSTAKEFVLGLKDQGSISLDMIWDENYAPHASLRTHFDAGTVNNYQIVDTSSPQVVYSFAAYIQGISMAMGVDEVNRATVNVRITGAMTIG